jgi:hypothetical protein
MVQIVTTLGPVVVSDEAIARIISRTPDIPYTHVWGPSGSSLLETAEDAGTLAARLQLAKPLSRLSVPTGEPIWIKGAAVTLIRPATPFEQEGAKPPIINSIVIVAGRTQALHEDFPTAYKILQAGGTHVPEVMMSLSTVSGEVEGFAIAPSKASDVYQAW